MKDWEAELGDNYSSVGHESCVLGYAWLLKQTNRLMCIHQHE